MKSTMNVHAERDTKLDYKCVGNVWKPVDKTPRLQVISPRMDRAGTKAHYREAGGITPARTNQYHGRSKSAISSTYGLLAEDEREEPSNPILRLNVEQGKAIRRLEEQREYYESLLKIVLPVIPALRSYSEKLHSLVEQCISQIQTKAEELKHEDSSDQEAVEALVSALETSLRHHPSPLNPNHHS